MHKIENNTYIQVSTNAIAKSPLATESILIGIWKHDLTIILSNGALLNDYKR